jgi:dTDP-4-amino-4,6-dideoxy-D-glucose acyltransferase
MNQLGGTYFSESELSSYGFGRLGNNVKIHSRASIYGAENIFIGDNVRIDDFVVIIATGKLTIGNYVSIHNFCFIGSKYGVTIGNFATFAPGVKIFSASDDYEGEFLTGVAVPPQLTGGSHAPVQIDDHVLVGAGSIILPGCHVSEGCAIGALSLVKCDLMPWGIYAGIPVQRRKERKKDLLQLTHRLMNVH